MENLIAIKAWKLYPSSRKVRSVNQTAHMAIKVAYDFNLTLYQYYFFTHKC